MIRILLVYDVPGWACESECKAIAKHLELCAPGTFAVTQACAGSTAADQLCLYDVVLSTIYYHLPEAAHPKSVSMVSSYSYWIRKGWDGGWPHLRLWKYMVAKNKHIRSLLTDDDHPDISLLYHVFDHDFWSPATTKEEHEDFRVGFAGHKQSLKGLDLIQKAVEGLEGVRLIAPTWEDGRIPHESMPDFYRSLDIYVCMSQHGQDAGPRPPIEAGLCGIPAITTNAGQIGEMVVDGQSGLVIDRSVEALRETIIKVKKDKDLLLRLASSVRQEFLTQWIMPTGRAWTSYLVKVAEGT